MSGSASGDGRVQIRPSKAKLELPKLRNGRVVGPLPHRPAADLEETGELGIGLDAQGLLDATLGHVHEVESRILDRQESSTLAQRMRSVSREMDTMAERIKRALSLREMTPGDLIAAKVLSKAGVYFLLDGTTKADKVRADTVTKLCKALGVNREWLLHGKGPIEGGAAAAEEPEWSDIQGYAQAVGLGKGAEAQEYAETHKLKFRADSLARKRLNPHKLAVMYGDGDSMLPRIQPGDAILFDTSDTTPRDGSLYVVMVHGSGNSEYQVKRAMVLDDAVFFVSDNPGGDHAWKKPKRMDAKRNPIEVVGRVRWIGSWEE